jgi:hypothetical protein
MIAGVSRCGGGGTALRRMEATLRDSCGHGASPCDLFRTGFTGSAGRTCVWAIPSCGETGATPAELGWMAASGAGAEDVRAVAAYSNGFERAHGCGVCGLDRASAIMTLGRALLEYRAGQDPGGRVAEKRRKQDEAAANSERVRRA